MAGALDSLLEQVYAASAQAFQANQARALEGAQRMFELGWQNSQALQHAYNLRYLQLGLDATEVSQAYRGNHLKSATEADAAQTVAEGQVYKDASQASLPVSQAQNSSNYHNEIVKSVTDAVLAAVLQKLQVTVPPQTGGFAAQSPSDREPAK